MKRTIPVTKVIALDFDGVIIDSNAAKEKCWQLIAGAMNPEWREIFWKQKSRIKGSRFDILEGLYRAVGMKPSVCESLARKTADHFNELVQRELRMIGVSEETRKALSALRGKALLYVNSATPREALEESIHMLDIRQYFVECYGSPQSKADNLRRIMRNENCSGHDITMVGDSEEDVVGAEEVGASFVGITSSWNGWMNKPYPLVWNLKELAETITVRAIYTPYTYGC